MSKHRLLPAAAVGLSALVLSGCAGTASPGVAATVGDETISASRVNELTGHLCTARLQQSDYPGQPLGELRQEVVYRLAIGSVAEQIADDYGVSPSATYQSGVAENTRAASALPEEARADYIEVMSTFPLANDILEQVGRAKLVAEGIAEPTVEQVSQTGADVFTSWPDANGVEVDPKYGFEIRDGEFAPVDSNLSYAFSDEAQAGLVGLEAEADPAAAASYTESLPSSQRCGD